MMFVFFEFHPVRPVCVTVSNSGFIFVWTQKPTQVKNNSLDPGYEEIKENIW